MLRASLTVTCCLVALAAGTGPAAAQVPSSIAAGHWEGTIQTPGEGLKIALDLAPSGEKWEGTIDIPPQGLRAFPLSAITVQADKVTFTMRGVPGAPEFLGTVAEDGKRLSGDFRQGGQTFPFALTRTGEAKIERPPASTPVTPELAGSWEGTLDVNGQRLRLVLKLANKAGGPASGSLVSLDQGGVEIPTAAVVQTGARLKVLVPSIAGTYDGELKDGTLTGTWTQGPGAWPLVLNKQKP